MAALANEVATEWNEDLWTLHAHLQPAIAQLDEMVDHLSVRLEADKIVMALSDYTDPWRKRVLPTYKQARGLARKPILLKPLRDYIHEVYTTWQRPSLEGDDVLGILMTNPSIIPGEKICVSEDKDLRTIPGLHATMRDVLREWGGFAPIREVTKQEADFFHMRQALMGDTTDGYSGCPGIGPKSADKLLEGQLWDDIWPIVVKAYVKAGLSEVEALQTARVARILRHGDYDYTKKEVRLWNPPILAV